MNKALIKIVFMLIIVLFKLECTCNAACTQQDVRNLKATGFTNDEIDTICPICTSDDFASYAQDEKSREEIIKLCSDRNAYTVSKPKKSMEEMEWYHLLIKKPFAIGFDTYHISKIIRDESSTGSLVTDNKGDDIFNVYLKYTLPISSMTYAFDKNRPDKPHPLLKALRLYAEGNITNGINSNDGASGLTIKTKTEKFYKVGVKFETDFETLFSSGKSYRASANY